MSSVHFTARSDEEWSNGFTQLPDCDNENCCSAIVFSVVKVSYDAASNRDNGDACESPVTVQLEVPRCHDVTYTVKAISTRTMTMPHFAALGHLRGSSESFSGL